MEIREDTEYYSTIEEAYDQRSSLIYHYAYRRLGSKEQAKDVMQDTFLAAFIHRVTFLQHKNQTAWLLLTARRLVAKQIMFSQRDVELSENLPSFSKELLWELLPVGLTPSELQLAELLCEKGLTHSDIAEIMGITLSACQSRVRRLRQTIGERLAFSGEIWQNNG